MQANDYQELAGIPASKTNMKDLLEFVFEAEVKIVADAKDSNKASLLMAGFGLGGEAGEVLDIIKKAAFHGHVLDVEKLSKELGDVQWYIARLASVLGLKLGDIMEQNIAKLEARYPGGFSHARSINRIDDIKPSDITSK